MQEKHHLSQLALGVEPAASKSGNIKLETQQMMRMLLELEISKEVITCLLEMAKFAPQHLCYLAGPIIVHRSPWAETLPAWLPKACLLERLDRIFEEHGAGSVGKLATHAEILAYMYPASMEAPMHRDWTNVYLWVANEAMTRHNRWRDGQKMGELICEKYLPEFEQVEDNCNQIARDIRRQVVKEGKRRGWGQKKKIPIALTDEVTVPSNPKSSEPDTVQLSLFG